MNNQADRMKGYRYIAPRHVDVQRIQMSLPSHAEEGKTKRASMACLECKKRRTKCSTGRPCSECATHERECIYDETADKRRKEHVMSTKNQLQATEEVLGFYHKFLEDLLESLRLGSKGQLHELVEVVQSTVRNHLPEEQGGYERIKETVYSILADYEDAEGTSDVEIGQDIIS
ncbi:hypothetical protein UA08_08982 [Talaromyces atroroseus]|uniref:Zn(2)-C6 fungal-type domain-containing protein n=1 Tax=Talaromyces atroroseus TaxID=1441469 RepID=A0A1Q5Q736_TALAT|nr:hypothetical protein UA08_08982 [Talaromyces atroroseus]OKL55654.1 hypothetical protein UA08_08982 [Talaromyces atroroseus]